MVSKNRDYTLSAKLSWPADAGDAIFGRRVPTSRLHIAIAQFVRSPLGAKVLIGYGGLANIPLTVSYDAGVFIGLGATETFDSWPQLHKCLSLA